MRQYLVALLLLISLSACTDSYQQVLDKHDAVMVIHDEAMAKMDLIYDQISSLRERQKQLNGGDSLSDPASQTEILDAIVKLQHADDEMMDWMAEYAKPGEDAELEKSLAYLESEKGKIEVVAKQIDEALEQGEMVLEKSKE